MVVKLETIVNNYASPLSFAVLNYLASIHHLRMVFQYFSEDQHGLCITNIDHKDKLNFEAVMYVTSKSVLKVLPTDS